MKGSVLLKKGVLKNLSKLTEKQLCQNLFLLNLKQASKVFKSTFFTEHLRESASVCGHIYHGTITQAGITCKKNLL